MDTLRDSIFAEARRLGFDAVAVARADVPLEAEYERYEAFLEQGMHGSMEWLGRSREVRQRLDGDGILPGARSVICLARKYGRSAEEEDAEPVLAQSIARYARGRDYHNGVRKKLRALAKYVRRLGTADAPIEARPMCDDAPVLERAWAARSGLGFIGKNGLLIVPGVGSLVLLGEVVTTLALPSGSILEERCGSCTRCLEACPTGAFAAPFVLDPRRCVAYLTIEHRGPVPEPLREGVGDHLFGCDDCQTVCPFNAGTRRRPTESVDARFVAHERWSELSLASLVALSEADFERLREGTPVARATRAGLARNAALVLGNQARRRALNEEERAALQRARCDHDSEVVRETAAWALASPTQGARVKVDG